MIGCSELFIKLVCLVVFLFVFNHVVLKFHMVTEGKYTSQQKCWDFGILEILF